MKWESQFLKLGELKKNKLFYAGLPGQLDWKIEVIHSGLGAYKFLGFCHIFQWFICDNILPQNKSRHALPYVLTVKMDASVWIPSFIVISFKGCWSFRCNKLHIFLYHDFLFAARIFSKVVVKSLDHFQLFHINHWKHGNFAHCVFSSHFYCLMLSLYLNLLYPIIWFVWELNGRSASLYFAFFLNSSVAWPHWLVCKFVI